MSSKPSQEKIYLIGDFSTQISGNKLPSKRDILKVLFFNLRCVGLTLRESAQLVIEEVFVFWNKARISVQKKSDCIDKVEKLHEEWRKIQKNKDRLSNKTREINFNLELDELFDIASANVFENLNQMQKEFLARQREPGRPGYILDIQPILEKINEKEKQREEMASQRITKQIQREKYEYGESGPNKTKLTC